MLPVRGHRAQIRSVHLAVKNDETEASAIAFVLDGKTPDQVVTERLDAEPTLARAAPNGRASPCDTTKARLVIERAEEVSQPDTG